MSCKVFVVGLRLKSDLLDHLKIFVAKVKCETSKQVEIITANIPQHNSVTKHMNHTLLDKVHTMLTNACLPNFFWYNTLKYTAILHNSLPTKPLPDVTLEEAWSSNKPKAQLKVT
jgi:hypothetical protein